jgi:indole-3-glycerol phosphate synthase
VVPSDTYLSNILAVHRARASSDERSMDDLVRAAQDLPATRPFTERLAASAGGGLGVIAEIKRRSPSKGVLDAALDPPRVAADYQAGGAACLSVLTDAEFFGGSPEDLQAARTASSLPILRKDFTVSALDVCDARLMGADAVLLIVAALSDDELSSFITIAQELFLDALVEVHDEHELHRALDAGAELVGVNQRDLRSFDVDADRAVRLAPSIPPEVVAVAESGIRDGDEARRLADAGYQAVLVGESLVRASDRQGALAALVGHPIGARRGAHHVGQAQS